MPCDDDANPIPALRLKPGGSHTIAATAASARNATPFGGDTRVIGIVATGPVFIRTGGSDVTAAATDHYFPAGVYYDLSLGNKKQGRHAFIAVRRAETDCTLYVSEKE
jgi:hypothetical protein